MALRKLASLFPSLHLRGMVTVVASCVALLGSACEDPAPPPDICSAARSNPVAKGALSVVLVIDRTSSSRQDVSAPPGLVDAVADVQADGVTSKAGSQIQVAPVAGLGQYPGLSKPLALDVEPGNTSQDAEAVRDKLLKDCVPALVTAAPASDANSTDLVGALLAAQQQKPGKIVVVSSGLNTTPAADLRAITEPIAAAEAVRAANPGFDHWDVPVVWFNLGEPTTPLSDQDRERLVAFWKALLGDDLSYDTREGFQPSAPATPTR